MNRDRGFTRVELVVVISITVLLPSILTPSFSKGRETARDVVCQSNLKQWIYLLSLYADDNDGNFPPGWSMNKGGWMSRLRPYYQDDSIRLCPMARKLQSDGYEPGTFVGWGIYGAPDYYGGWTPPWGDEGDYGSYGINGWIYNPPDEGDLYPIPPSMWPLFWRNITAGEEYESPSNIPVFCDSIWDGTMVRHTDWPPPEPGHKMGMEGMWNFCIPRHGNGDSINICFLDGSVRRTTLKCLWKLKWHKKFKTDVNVQWPPWMQNIKEECE
jgi:prepilin-type processing-associated H-X9-DG protein